MATRTDMQRGRTWPYLLFVLLLGFAGYTAMARWWSYSDGERVGILQKLSRKGWVCKTYEGELAQYVIVGLTPQIWSFTASDPEVAQKLNALLGERVRLHYGEHVGLPSSCFGDTRYFVDHVELVDPQVPAPATAPPATAPATAPPATAPMSPDPAPAATPLPST